MKISHILEALPLSTAKKYRKGWDPSIHKDIFARQADKDKNAFRIYLPFESSPQKPVSVPEKIQTFLQTAIPNKPYETTPDNYVRGIATEVGNPNRQLGIGKMLARSLSQAQSSKDEVAVAQLNQLKKDYDNDPQRQATQKADKLIAISRHPYDIAGMSTDRGWMSCMNLIDGINRRYVIDDVKNACLIAYLINSDDRNINQPLARILIKPYHEKDNPSNLIMMGDQVYGTAPAHFEQEVHSWIDKNYNQGKTGLYCINPEVYRDVLPRELRIWSDKEIQDAPAKDLVKLALSDQKIWKRISELRPDADSIFWAIVNKQYNPTAVGMIKNIDAKMFVKLVRKHPVALKYLKNQTPELVALALKTVPESLVYVRERTPEQNKTLENWLRKQQAWIGQVENPTPGQLLASVAADISNTQYVLQINPQVLNLDIARKYIKDQVKNWTSLDDSEMQVLLKNFPELSVQDQDLDNLITLNPGWTMMHVKMSPQQLRQSLMKLDSDWYEEFEDDRADVQTLARKINQIPNVKDDAKLMNKLANNLASVVGLIPGVDEKYLFQAIRNNYHAILSWPNPTDDMWVLAFREADYDDGDLIERLLPAKDHMRIWTKLVDLNPNYVMSMDKAPRELLHKAIANPQMDDYNLRLLLNQSDVDSGTKVRILKKDPRLIARVLNPSLALQMAAIHADPDVYDLIKPKLRAPAARAYMAAYKREMRKPE